tara:strand:+ start:440 stop:874 length:435 start_codon:yes stop_codon:yes gene_type:complete
MGRREVASAETHNLSRCVHLAPFVHSTTCFGHKGHNKKAKPNKHKQTFLKHDQLIGIHTLSHAHLASISHQQMCHEIDAAMQIFRNATGERPWFFRAPYGELNDDARNHLMKQKLFTFHWDVDSLDWANPHNNIKETVKILKKV